MCKDERKGRVLASSQEADGSEAGLSVMNGMFVPPIHMLKF